MGKIRTTTVLMLTTFLPLLLPEGIWEGIGIPMKLRLIIWGLDWVFVFILLFRKRQKPSMPFIILMLIYSTIIYSACIQGHDELVSVLSINFCGIVMSLVFEYWLKNHFYDTIRFLYLSLFILVGINFIFLLTFPDGLYTSTLELPNVTIASQLTYNLNWLFGYKNNQFGYTLPFLAIICIYKYFKDKKLKKSNIVIFSICILTEILAQATMATVLLIIYTITIFLILNKRSKLINIIKKFYNVKTIIFAVIIVVLNIVVFTSDNWIANIMTEASLALGKDTKFNGRSQIWTVSINFIRESPIIGYGNINSEVFIEQSKVLGGTHAHNYLLHIMILGGILCLIEHILLYFVTIKEMTQNRGIISEMAGIVLGLFFINGITSVNFYYPLFNAMFILFYYSIDYYKKLPERNYRLNH